MLKSSINWSWLVSKRAFESDFYKDHSRTPVLCNNLNHMVHFKINLNHKVIAQLSS